MNKAIVDDLAKSSTQTLTKISSDSAAAAQELTKAYQEVATRNLKNVMSALQALATVKTPTAFLELQQKLIKDGMEDAMKDGQHIAKLTTAVFAAALEPVKQHMAK
jgi:phasin family protein